MAQQTVRQREDQKIERQGQKPQIEGQREVTMMPSSLKAIAPMRHTRIQSNLTCVYGGRGERRLHNYEKKMGTKVEVEAMVWVPMV